MANTRQGSIHLFRFAGVDVFLHWYWFLVAAYEVQARKGVYSSILWNVLEYLSLFVIVLLHEFGHALACRQVGGTANQILLWPFGGVAYVDPPPRPGATLWSIAAGPLVNVVLTPILLAVGLLGRSAGWALAAPDAYQLLWIILTINVYLLVFNMLPVYPLDGGQILRSLLWFVLGRGRSLLVATILGFVGAAGFIAYAVWRQSFWLGLLSLYLLMNCWSGWQQARALLRMAKLPRNQMFACPWCKSAPPIGDYWKCGQCGRSFDTFQSRGVCPHCSSRFEMTQCLDCGRSHSMNEWIVTVLVPSNL